MLLLLMMMMMMFLFCHYTSSIQGDQHTSGFLVTVTDHSGLRRIMKKPDRPRNTCGTRSAIRAIRLKVVRD